MKRLSVLLSGAVLAVSAWAGVVQVSSATTMPGQPAVAENMAPAGVVHQGMTIPTTKGSCSLTVLNETTGYTSAHCANGVWQPGTQLHSASGVLGVVTEINTDIDVLKIRFDERIHVEPGLKPRPSHTLKPGEPVFFYGNGTKVGPMRVSSTDSRSWLDGRGVVYTAFPQKATPGMSGGPVIDQHGQLVGVLAGRTTFLDTGVSHSTFVPWDVVLETLGD